MAEDRGSQQILTVDSWLYRISFLLIMLCLCACDNILVGTNSEHSTNQNVNQQEDDNQQPPSPPTPKSVAINLSFNTHYTTQLAFVNMFNQASDWVSHGTDGTWNNGMPIATDDNGWVTSLASEQTVGVLIGRDIDGKYPAGMYTLLYDGQGDINIEFDGAIVSQSPGQIEFMVTPSGGGTHIEILTTSPPPNHVRNIRVFPNNSENTYSDTFRDSFLEALEPFQGIRFMDWQQTNDSELISWNERTTTEHFTQTTKNGVALEYQIELANTLTKDPWFNLPHQVDDHFVRQMAEMIYATLDPNLVAYIEYSNEVWNTVFEQNKYALNQAVTLGIPGDTVWQQGRRFYAQRSKEIFEIFADVFGSERHRLRFVLAGQNATPTNAIDILEWQDAHMLADSYAVAPYIGGGMNGMAGDLLNMIQTPPGTIDENVIDFLFEQLTQDIPDRMQKVVESKSIANQYGLTILGYEGGQHMVHYAHDPQLTEHFIEANRDPRMYDIYLEYLDQWRQSGGDLMFAYSFTRPPNQHGSWGVLEDLYQTLDEAPKFKALKVFSDNNPIWW